MREIVDRCALACAGDELAIGRTEIEAAGLREERLGRFLFERAPKVPRAAEQRDVAGVLEVREADDAREAAGRSEGVAARELLEAEDAQTALREMCRRGRAMGSEADDDRVVGQGLGFSTGRSKFATPACSRRPGTFSIFVTR